MNENYIATGGDDSKPATPLQLQRVRQEIKRLLADPRVSDKDKDEIRNDPELAQFLVEVA